MKMFITDSDAWFKKKNFNICPQSVLLKLEVANFGITEINNFILLAQSHYVLYP